jgi:hypothetical protein
LQYAILRELPFLSPRELFIYCSELPRNELPPKERPSKPPQELFPRSYPPGSCPPENSLYIAASYPLGKRYKREEDNVDLVRCASREYI